MKKTFGNRIHEERIRCKMTLCELGREIGSTKSYIWELENKTTYRPSADKLLKLADALGVSPDYLINGNVENDEDVAFYRKFRSLSEDDKEILKRIMRTFKAGESS